MAGEVALDGAAARRRATRRRCSVERAEAGGLDVSDGRCGAGRADLRAARRAAAGRRAGCGANPVAVARRHRRPDRRPLPAADHRRPHRRAAPADAAQRRRLELRPAVRRRAAGVPAAVGVRRRVRPRRRRGGVRRRRRGGRRRRRHPRSSRRQVAGVGRSSRDDGTRYRLLQTLVDYGRERLVEAGEHDATRDRHLRWMVEFAAEAEPGLRGPDQPRWIRRLGCGAGQRPRRAGVGACSGDGPPTRWRWRPAWPTAGTSPAPSHEGQAFIVRALAQEGESSAEQRAVAGGVGSMVDPDRLRARPTDAVELRRAGRRRSPAARRRGGSARRRSWRRCCAPTGVSRSRRPS